jgi:xylulose-5-phosphate/fructose-6-phosphate phosphoketolase
MIQYYWLKSYQPQELFNERGRLKPELAERVPTGEDVWAPIPTPTVESCCDLRMPDFHDYAVNVPSPGTIGAGDTHVLGRFLRDVVKLNVEQRNFHIFGPDETFPNGLEAVFKVTNRQWEAAMLETTDFSHPADTSWRC